MTRWVVFWEMERREGLIVSEKPNIQPPTFREWLLAVLLFPVTIKRLAEGIHQLVDELKYYREIPQRLADLDEVGRDFNTGIYGLFDGKVRYRRPDNHQDSQKC